MCNWTYHWYDPKGPLSLNSEVELAKQRFIELLHRPIISGFNFGEVDVKKPECPARKSGDEWPKWLFLWKKPVREHWASSLLAW